MYIQKNLSYFALYLPNNELLGPSLLCGDNYELNAKTHNTQELSTPDSKVKVYVVPTNEELAIVKDTVKILGL